MGVGMGVKRLKSQSSELIPKKTPYPRARRLLLPQVWGFEVPRIPPRLLQTGRRFHSLFPRMLTSPATIFLQRGLAVLHRALTQSWHLRVRIAELSQRQKCSGWTAFPRSHRARISLGPWVLFRWRSPYVALPDDTHFYAVQSS